MAVQANQPNRKDKTMTHTEIISAVSSLARAKGAFYGIQSITTPKLNKKSRATKEPWTKGEVVVRASFSAKIGIDYENAVNNERERNGEARDFVAVKPTGKHHIEGIGGEYILQSDTNPEQFYLALDCVGGSVKEWFIGGRPATEEEIADLKANYLPKPSESKFAGLWRTYKVESIVSIS